MKNNESSNEIEKLASKPLTRKEALEQKIKLYNKIYPENPVDCNQLSQKEKQHIHSHLHYLKTLFNSSKLSKEQMKKFEEADSNNYFTRKLSEQAEKTIEKKKQAEQLIQSIQSRYAANYYQKKEENKVNQLIRKKE